MPGREYAMRFSTVDERPFAGLFTGCPVESVDEDDVGEPFKRDESFLNSG